MDSLPNFLTHGAPLARFARESSAIKCLVVEEQPATNYIQTVYLNGVKGEEKLHRLKPQPTYF